MAYDGSVVINTKLNNRGIIKGVRDAAKQIETLTEGFKKTSAAIKEQSATVDRLRRNYEEAAEDAKKGVKGAAESAKEFSKRLKDAQKDFTALTDKSQNFKDALARISEKGIFDFAGQAQQAQEDIRAFGDALQRLDEQLAKEQDPATIKALKRASGLTSSAFTRSIPKRAKS